MRNQAFDDFSDAYEAMIDWPRRLAHEEGFYRRLFDEVRARSVLDVACGTGRHAAMFHSWGLTVEGADISPAMIERCRERFGESQTLRWVVRGFDQPHPEPASFDVAICVGNSLALAGDEAAVAAALRQMLAAVRPGGRVLIHVLNLWRLPDGPAQWQKCVRASLPEGESLIVKGVHRAGSTGYVNMIVARLDLSEPRMRTECVPFVGLEAAGLEAMLGCAGATRIETYGAWHMQPYDREQSPDLIMVATK
ncbi:MAG TPA: class I SAM-dependent methyltransferase [Phycisphaerae bacterium]|jgi:SAM-dependent methyltransferase|nr:class I SAM-dependent methyltransferase [Phycisphaerae bacterium]HOJ54255.1 class I SAM-dependent methyltransferase [Phycisphaerae bacterium]HOL26726.1 class I SAM-dependent methyltransferase [Phycisphaerae bacterium]HPP20612.1 class I SAM-dependent methyltransferase [Phycisphaerae bacterium]HPU34644.1 class I SAM-dependent methyltransferase [Phycisphaerae bacterium]